MMRRMLIVLLVGTALVSLFLVGTHAGEWKGAMLATSITVPAGSPPIPGTKETEQPGMAERNFMAKEGRRMHIVVVGDHDPVVRVRLQVRSTDGTWVYAQDDGGDDNISRDMTAVTFVPPRAGSYILRVESFGIELNVCKVFIRQ
jgi:hypothetical protein